MHGREPATDPARRWDALVTLVVVAAVVAGAVSVAALSAMLLA